MHGARRTAGCMPSREDSSCAPCLQDRVPAIGGGQMHIPIRNMRNASIVARGVSPPTRRQEMSFRGTCRQRAMNATKMYVSVRNCGRRGDQIGIPM